MRRTFLFRQTHFIDLRLGAGEEYSGEEFSIIRWPYYLFRRKAWALCMKILFVIKGQRWRNWRTNLTPVFISGKMNMMFYLVDTCGKELANCLVKAFYIDK